MTLSFATIVCGTVFLWRVREKKIAMDSLIPTSEESTLHWTNDSVVALATINVLQYSYALPIPWSSYLSSSKLT